MLFWLAAGEKHIGEMISSDMATDSHNHSLALGGHMAGSKPIASRLNFAINPSPKDPQS